MIVELNLPAEVIRIVDALVADGQYRTRGEALSAMATIGARTLVLMATEK